MPSWMRAWGIAFGSVVVGFIFSLLWIIIAGIVVNTYFRGEVDAIVRYVEQQGLSGVYELPEFVTVGLIILFFLFLSGLSFYAILVKFIWNEVQRDFKRELEEQRKLKKDSI